MYTGIWNNDLNGFVKDPNGRDLPRMYVYGESPGFQEIPRNQNGFNYDEYIKSRLKRDPGDVKAYKSETMGSKENPIFPKNLIGKNVSPMSFHGGPGDDVGGYLGKFRYKDDGSVAIDYSDIWDFLPDDYKKKWIDGYNNDENTKKLFLFTTLLNNVGKPFILRNNDQPVKVVDLNKELNSVENDYSVKRYIKNSPTFSDWYDENSGEEISYMPELLVTPYAVMDELSGDIYKNGNKYRIGDAHLEIEKITGDKSVLDYNDAQKQVFDYYMFNKPIENSYNQNDNELPQLYYELVELMGLKGADELWAYVNENGLSSDYIREKISEFKKKKKLLKCGGKIPYIKYFKK